MSKVILRATVNGEAVETLTDARRTLLEWLRDELKLTGSKEGCGNGNCGACTVLFEGKPVLSCLVMAAEAEGRSITTVEGIAAKAGEAVMSPLQKAFVEEGGLQCGFCTPGFVVCATALLEKLPNPSEHEIRLHLANNLCRCTGYDKIVSAVEAASRQGPGPKVGN